LRELVREGVAPFDAVFIDADKPGYVEYLDLVIQLSHSGRVILADNRIRNGRVLEDNPRGCQRCRSQGLQCCDCPLSALESILVPVLRGNVDGLSLSIVK
jgi:predicted O-methyltransferase YrrM